MIVNKEATLAADKPLISLSDLTKLQDQLDKPDPLDYNAVSDYAVAVMVVLRGLPRGEKLKILRKAIKLCN